MVKQRRGRTWNDVVGRKVEGRCGIMTTSESRPRPTQACRPSKDLMKFLERMGKKQRMMLLMTSFEVNRYRNTSEAIPSSGKGVQRGRPKLESGCANIHRCVVVCMDSNCGNVIDNCSKEDGLVQDSVIRLLLPLCSVDTRWDDRPPFSQMLIVPTKHLQP